MSDIWFVTGGARSGKSSYAEKLVAGKGSVLYIATGVAFDEEMESRIERHKADRPKDWITWERFCDLSHIESEFQPDDFGAIILECIGNLFMGVLFVEVPDENVFTDEDFERIEQIGKEDIAALCAYANKYGKRLVFVSNEIGMGIVPKTRYVRNFRDSLGRINQYVATLADKVVLMVSGIPLEVK